MWDWAERYYGQGFHEYLCPCGAMDFDLPEDEDDAGEMYNAA